MEGLEFSEIVYLLNKTHYLEVDETPVKQSKGNWQLYRGNYKVHLSETPFEVLYLSSKATVDSVRDAFKSAFTDEHTQVVYAESLLRSTRVPAELFRGKAKVFSSARDYLASFLKVELTKYAEKLKSRVPKYFEMPQIKVPAGYKQKTPNPLELLLQDDAYNPESGGRVGVVLAEPGQGKTFLCEHLVARGAVDRSRTPIYINSEQWVNIPVDDLSSLEKTITHSFRHFGATIGWLDGCEDDFLKITLKAGMFYVIFDGLDEYILKNKGRVQLTDVVAAILNLANSTGANVIFTSRTWFWESEFNSEGPSECDIFCIEPFDENHARNYFQKRFPSDSKKTNAAVDVYRKIHKSNSKLAGRGFVLQLIADVVQYPGDNPSQALTGKAIDWLLLALCNREQLRQELPISGAQQLEMLRAFVEEVVKGSPPNSDLVDLCLQICAPQLDAKTRTSTLRSLSTHPLISHRVDDDTWSITQDQVRIFLLADVINEYRKSESNAALRELARSCALERPEVSDLSTMLVDITGTGQSNAFDISKVGIAAAALIRLQPKATDRPGDLLNQIATNMMLRALDIDLPKGSSRSERASKLCEFLGDSGMLHGLHFAGSLSRIDFSNKEFRNCHFDEVSFSNCLFSTTTIFHHCRFRGGTVNHCLGFGNAKFIEPTCDHLAEKLIRVERIRAKEISYTREDIERDLADLIGKFINRKTGVSFRSVTESNLRTGPIMKSPHSKEIIKEFKRRLTVEHSISGSSDPGYAISAEAKDAFKFYTTNGVFSGPLRQTFETLEKKLL